MHQLNLFDQNGKIYVVKELSRRMKYTVKNLRADFPDDEACLEWLVNWLYPDGITCKQCEEITKHHKLKGRRVYSCDRCGTHVSPTAGTIFHKSSTPLTDWFYAIWLMSSNKAGTAAKQLERELGVSYPTAWRMMHKIRTLMEAPDELFDGEVEVDETFIHGNTYKRSSAHKKYGYVQGGRRTGEIVFGMVRRGGAAKVWHVKSVGTRSIMPHIEANILRGTTVYSDGWDVYRTLPKRGYEHMKTNHGQRQYVDLENRTNHTQNIENVWSHFKRGIKGVYRKIGKGYVQAYANEYAWRYSHRNDVSMFWSLMGEISK